MKLPNIVRALVLVSALLGVAATSTTARADETGASAAAAKGVLLPVSKVDAAWLAKAEAAYPLNVCPVSGNDLDGSMGTPVERVYRVAGQPDRLIRFCCKKCFKDFNKNPGKYLKMIDEAAAKKAAAAPAAK